MLECSVVSVRILPCSAGTVKMLPRASITARAAEGESAKLPIFCETFLNSGRAAISYASIGMRKNTFFTPEQGLSSYKVMGFYTKVFFDVTYFFVELGDRF